MLTRCFFFECHLLSLLHFIHLRFKIMTVVKLLSLKLQSKLIPQLVYSL